MNAPFATIGPSSLIQARRLLGMELARTGRSGDHQEDAEFIRAALEVLDDKLAAVKESRKNIAAAVEALIDHLDCLDGDPDLEDDDREHEEPEPSLGWTTAIDQAGGHRYFGGVDDCEHEVTDQPHDGDEREDDLADCG